MEREPVQRLFDCMAEKMPEQVAISCGETRVTYRELQQRTDKLAQLLIAGGNTSFGGFGLVANFMSSSL